MHKNHLGEIEAAGGALARKHKRLLDAASRSAHDSIAQRQYAAWCHAWASGDAAERARLQRGAKADEAAAANPAA